MSSIYTTKYYKNTFLSGVAISFFNTGALAAPCPTPIIVANTSCEVASGTTMAVATANTIGLNVSGVLGVITANGIIENLGAATTTGMYAQSGGRVLFNGSTLTTTATTTAASAGHVGVRANGTNSHISATGSSITLGPANGTTTAANLTGVRLENGGGLTFNNTQIRILGGTGFNNIGLVSTGAGSQASLQGGSISAAARSSFAALAEDSGSINLEGTSITTSGASAVGARAQSGGSITLSDLQISTSGAGTAAAGSHALQVNTGSQVTASRVTLNALGNFSSAARADGGSLTLNASTLTSAGTSSADTDPSSALRGLSGGTIQLIDSNVTATGQRGNGFSVENAGTSIQINNSTISAAGTRAKAGYIFNGATAIVNNSALLSSNMDAVSVQDPGSSIELTDSVIHSTAVLGLGLRVTLGASATLTRGSSTTDGRDSPALFVSNGNIVATDVVLKTSGNDNSVAVLADINGTININGGSITTSGDAVRLSSFPHAVGARNPGAVATLNNTTILTTGYTAMGAVADDGGRVLLTNTPIRTEGDRSIGLFSVTEQVGSQFTAHMLANNVSVETFGLNAHGATSQARNEAQVEKAITILEDNQIKTHGDNAVGLRAILADYGTRPIAGRGEATVTATNTTVFTEGTNAFGALSRDNPTSVTMNDTSVLATGTFAHGAVAADGGLIIGNQTTIKAQGTLGFGLFVIGTADKISKGTFTNSLLNNVNGPTIAVAGVGDVMLTNSKAYGSGHWLSVAVEADFPALPTNDPIHFGIPDVDNPDAPPPGSPPPPSAPIITPGFANITLSDSTVIGSAFTAEGSVSNVTLLNNSFWEMTANSNVTNLINDPSFIQFTPPGGDPNLLASYKTLTTVNYIGYGGILGLNTYLGGDNSPSDRLIIDGGLASGFSPLQITNTIGPGALTVGNGILVVETINGGATEPNTFSLNNVVAAGPYEYLLFRGGVTPGFENDWFLRSSATPSPDPTPLYRLEATLYNEIPLVANQMALFTLGTFHERKGDQSLLQESGLSVSIPMEIFGVNAQSLKNMERGSAIWGRVYGQSLNQQWTGVLSPEFKGNMLALQVGADLIQFKSPAGHQDKAGLFYAFARSNGNGKGFVLGQEHVTAGVVKVHSNNLGAYWTHMGPTKWYIDGVLIGSFYDNEALSRRYIGAHFDGDGITGSLEGGVPLKLTSSLNIEPQVQAIWQHTSFDNSGDLYTRFAYDLEDNLVIRAGLRLEKSIFFKNMHLQPFAIANLWHAFAGTYSTVFNNAVALPAIFDETVVEVGGGLVAKITKNAGIYARASYTGNVNGTFFEAVKGQFGVRATW